MNIWQCVKTLYPCSSHQNSWDLWMFIPLKMVLIGIDPYPFMNQLPGPSIAPHQRLWFLVDLQHCFGGRGSVATFEVHPVEGIHGGILWVGTMGFGKSWVNEVATRCNTLQHIATILIILRNHFWEHF